MESSFKYIQAKLESFVRRFYVNELLKGTILFFAIGLFYLLITLLIEYIFWLNSLARTVLFWVFVSVEVAFLIKFIFIPIAKMLKLKKGIDYHYASRIIGNHFPEVSDKLLNVLQLQENKQHSDLLLASIEQKAKELSPIPFKLAINLKENVKYLKYASIPLFIIIVSFVYGKLNWFNSSLERVINYNMAFEPPAPFQFFVINKNLNALENQDFTLKIRTVGDYIPNDVKIVFNNQHYVLEQTALGEFEYEFKQLKNSVEFKLDANQVTSKPYTINVVEVPSLVSFVMLLDYPKYINRPNELLSSTGNATVPEGTKITWLLKTKATEGIQFFSKDTLNFTRGNADVFNLSKYVFNNFNYAISTSNNYLKNYENLSFNIDVVKDDYPNINVLMKQDSLDLQTLYFKGDVSDDYGISKLQLIYYPTQNTEKRQSVVIDIPKSSLSSFVTSFPNNLNIEPGVSYQLFFQVFDNDAINKNKSVKSSSFIYRKRTDEEEATKQLNAQGASIKDLNKSLKQFQDQERDLENLTRIQKEKSRPNFNDKKKLENFIQRQSQQDEIMKNFNKKLNDNLEEFKKESIKEDRFKEALKDRLKDNEKQLEKDEKLLEELEKIQDKISQEELVNKLEALAKQNKNKKRSLEQLLELTKRYYVEKKLDKLKDDLERIGERQEDLSRQNEEQNTKEKQESLNKDFEEFTKNLEELKKEGTALKKPIKIPQDKLEENEIKKEQKNAIDELNNNENSKGNSNSNSLKNAQKNQQKAAQKIKNLSRQMQSAMQAGSGEQLQEDVEMLRQILDNVLLYSFEQENLMNQFKKVEENHNKFATYVKKQNSLREHFERIDDSLFALSLRQPKFSENVNKQISDVYYNVDKALELFTDSKIYQGVSNQQYAITAVNNLSDFLSDILDNMQESLSMSAGKGGQGDMQLPDIIMSQEELNKMMEEGLKKGENGKPQNQNGDKDGRSNEKSNGDKKGENKGNKENINGNSEGIRDEMNGLLYQIYQQQQELRNALQEQLAKEGKGSNGNALIRKMEEIELDLLNKGFTNETLQKMLNLKHELLKLEKAAMEQGEDNRRESKTNQESYSNATVKEFENAKQYFNTTEILNRQALPLQPIYKKKVQNYFKEDNDKL